MKINKNKLLNWKSPLFIITSIISAFLLFLFGCWIGTKATTKDFNTIYGGISTSTYTSPGTVHFSEATDTEPMKIWKEDATGNKLLDDFKILTLTDIHLKDSGSDFCLKILDRYIQLEKPDLVVLCGDNIFRCTGTKYPYQLQDLFEKREQYWTFVLGNHDGEGWERDRDSPDYWPARQKAFNLISGVERYGKQADHCLARSITDDADASRYGYGTNQIDVIGSNNQPIQSLFFFDCMTIDHKNDTVKNWLSNQLQDINNDVIGFTHKPFKEMDDCLKKIGKDPQAQHLWGINDERICYDGTYSGVFDVLADNLDNNPVMVFGHDHVNNLALSYKGVKLIYSLGLQYNSYNSRFSELKWIYDIGYVLDNSICSYIDGVSEFIVNKGKPLTIANKYNQFSGALDGLKTELWKVTKGNFTYGVKGFTIALDVILPLTSLYCATFYIEFAIYQINKKKGNKKRAR